MINGGSTQDNGERDKAERQAVTNVQRKFCEMLFLGISVMMQILASGTNVVIQSVNTTKGDNEKTVISQYLTKEYMILYVGVIIALTGFISNIIGSAFVAVGLDRRFGNAWYRTFEDNEQIMDVGSDVA
ncbi:unnamed protein product [Bursaphelenchus okinawaensis]|uniref:Uncharacterized protein n=1 Tax=Bursaphelenchus okinawaensis TaxID=465554 RepID=A0A811LMK4_9BILA|nr:unnamed protein product [Bursaphelenchus okinawaensis]CAG9128114.1 unnamed protein product [Bursaphelenchus okinawaensis]